MRWNVTFSTTTEQQRSQLKLKLKLCLFLVSKLERLNKLLRTTHSTCPNGSSLFKPKHWFDGTCYPQFNCGNKETGVIGSIPAVEQQMVPGMTGTDDGTSDYTVLVNIFKDILWIWQVSVDPRTTPPTVVRCCVDVRWLHSLSSLSAALLSCLAYADRFWAEWLSL